MSERIACNSCGNILATVVDLMGHQSMTVNVPTNDVKEIGEALMCPQCNVLTPLDEER